MARTRSNPDGYRFVSLRAADRRLDLVRSRRSYTHTMPESPPESPLDLSEPVEGDPFAGAPNRAVVRAPDGTPMLCYTPGEAFTEPTRWAVAVWVVGEFGQAHVQAACSSFAGWRLSTADRRLVSALVERGAREQRHAHSLRLNLEGRAFTYDLAPGLRVASLSAAQVERHALGLGEVVRLAYPPTHPDWAHAAEPDPSARLRAIARGEMLGPMGAESHIAISNGAIAGACLTVEPLDGTLEAYGCWVADLFRRPDAPAGTGLALLMASLAVAADAGIARVGLVVSDANAPARRLYDRVGFAEVEESWTLVVAGVEESLSADILAG